ncbi:transposase [Paenibacillus algorifonticola]|uniref:transposase n=1 Tax=Paenibacillus algorifonticola TaxID=684063 RepID=UPI001160A8EF
MIEAIPDSQLFTHYAGGGRSSYHPKMMLKIILIGYSQKVYSCRGIEKLLCENIPAMQQPDFHTLNDFRVVRMKTFMDELFEMMIHKLLADNACPHSDTHAANSRRPALGIATATPRRTRTQRSCG